MLNRNRRDIGQDWLQVPVDRLWLGLMLLVLSNFIPLNAASSFAEETSTPSRVVGLDRKPYDVRLLVAFDSSLFDESSIRDRVHDVELAARRCAGEMWSVTTSEISWLNPCTERTLNRIDLASLAAQYPDETADIWFVATVEAKTGRIRMSVRSWQPEVQFESRTVQDEISDDRELGVTLIRLCRDLFRPMGILEQAFDRDARIRLRAGELPPADPTFAQVAVGDLLQPMLVHRNKEKAIEKWQSIPWTYILVEKVDASIVDGKVQSGVRVALGGKKRARVDTLVVVLKPQWTSTRLELTSQTKPPLPLVAHRLEVRTDPIIPRSVEGKPPVDPNSTIVSELLTDRRGLANVDVQPGKPLLWVFAYSGQHMLARIPFVPGVVGHARLEVPDDATRLTTEADLQMLQGEIVDAVALRNTAIATIRASAKKKDWQTVDEKFRLIRQTQSASELSDRLLAIRVAGTAAAKSRKDKAAESRINRMCDDAATLIDVHLNEEKVRQLNEEIEVLRNADPPAHEHK